jgi:hypothetical protein
MTSVAPTRYHVALTFDEWRQEWVEHRQYWDETKWTPTSQRGIYFHGDQTALTAAGDITFLDCHIFPGAAVVFPFGEWGVDTVGTVHPVVEIEEHSTGGVNIRLATLVVRDGIYQLDITPGTRRVCTTPKLAPGPIAASPRGAQ